MLSHLNSDVHLTDDKGWMKFHYYAKNGEHQNINDLVHMGINIHLKTNNGKTVFILQHKMAI